MAKMLCKCNHVMGTSACPSPYTLFIYNKAEVEAALRQFPGIHLADFLFEWDEVHQCQCSFMKRSEPVEYWYCIECRRVYEVQGEPFGRWLRIYQPVDAPAEKVEVQGWTRIYVLTDIATDAATERDYNISLADYLKQAEATNPVYYLSQDETVLYGIDRHTGLAVLSYRLEEFWSPGNSK